MSVKPALSAEQWSSGKRIMFREGKYDEGYGVEGMETTGNAYVFDGSWAVSLDADVRHPLAAVCLYKQPYGFTWRDVDLIRALATWLPPEWRESEASFRSIADRIEALLPPR